MGDGIKVGLVGEFAFPGSRKPVVPVVPKAGSGPLSNLSQGKHLSQAMFENTGHTFVSSRTEPH